MRIKQDLTLEVITDRLLAIRVAFQHCCPCGFTLPFGLQFTKDGTAIFLVCILLFAAQSQGQALQVSTIVVIALTGMLLTTGAGSVPGGGLVVGLVFVKAFGLPVEMVVLIGGIYHLLDMTNTTLNMMNDLVATVIASRLEGSIQVKDGAIVPATPIAATA